MKESVVFLVVVYEVLSRLSLINSLCWKFKWFVIRSPWLSMIVLNDLPVINVISRIVRGSSITQVVGNNVDTTCHSHIM